MARFGSGSTRLLLLFGVFSLGAVLAGALVCAMSGAPAALWLRNLAAWLVGALAAAVIAASVSSRGLPYILWAAPVALAATFAGAGQDGVHRWVNAGPVSMNMAMLVLPMAVVALAVLGSARRSAWLPALMCLAILAVQPDASQAAAFGLAAGLIAVLTVSGRTLKGAIVLVALGLIAAAWLRPDPLQPVPEVEEIIDLAYRLSPLLAGLALALLTGASVAPALGSRGSPRPVQIWGAALSVYFLACTVMPFLGHFPVPLVGIGLSPVLGSWLAVGWLAGLMRLHSGDANLRRGL